MLRYSVKISGIEPSETKVEWDGRYIAPDLSYASGWTDPRYHMNTDDYLKAYSRTMNMSSRMSCACEEATINGVIVLTDRKYPLSGASIIPQESNEAVNYKYFEADGRNFYATVKEDKYTFTVDHWTSIENGEIVEITKDVSASTATSTTSVSLTACYVVFSNKVSIDGVDFYLEFDGNGNFKGVKTEEDGEVIDLKTVIDCSNAIYMSVRPKDVTKIWLRPTPSEQIGFEMLSAVKYVPSVVYHSNICKVGKKEIETNVYAWVCEIPKYVLDGKESFTYTQAFEEGALNYTDFILMTTELEDSIISATTMDGLPSVNKLNDIYSPYILVNEDAFNVSFTMASSNNDGSMMVRLDGEYQFQEDEEILFTSRTLDGGKIPVFNGTAVIGGVAYDVEPRLTDYVKFTEDGVEHSVQYGKMKSGGRTRNTACVEIDGEWVDMILSGRGDNYSAITLTYVTVLDGSGNTKNAKQTYKITRRDGVEVNGKKYPVYSADGETYIEYDGDTSYKFRVKERVGMKAIICDPYVVGVSDQYKEALMSRIVNMFVANYRQVSIVRENHILGIEKLSPKKGLGEYNGSDGFPTSSDSVLDVLGSIELYKDNSYISLSIPLSNDASTDYLTDDLRQSEFIDVEREKAINRIIDMEKDVYVPKMIKSISKIDEEDVNSDYDWANAKFVDLKEIRINLHFRTRDMTTWKVNEEYNLEDSMSGLCGWFITDYEPYKSILETYVEDDDGTHKESVMSLDDMSDLVGLMGFSNYDIYYKKSNVSKSFIRLSFYDSIDKQTQSLLCTSTVYMNSSKLLKKYISNMRNGKFVNVDDDSELTSSYTSTVMSESGDSQTFFTPDVHVFINEDAEARSRLSSRFVIDNKHISDKSSEGFYLYMFKEYSDNLHPKPIYLKVDFNHAGIGQTIPFMVPMKWSVKAFGSNEYEPTDRLLIYKEEDRKMLYSGYTLDFINQELYIPLLAVYDYTSKEYSYVIDKRYAKESDGIVTIDMFEIKIGESPNKNGGSSSARRKVKSKINFDVNNFVYDSED